VIERLVRARGRGVKVEVMARASHTLKRDKVVEGVGGLRILDDVGIKVHKLKHLKLHGKALLRDGTAAIVGSINLATGSLDGRRELAIEVRDENVIDRLHKTLKHDWRHSRPPRSIRRGAARGSGGSNRGRRTSAVTQWPPRHRRLSQRASVRSQAAHATRYCSTAYIRIRRVSFATMWGLDEVTAEALLAAHGKIVPRVA